MINRWKFTVTIKKKFLICCVLSGYDYVQFLKANRIKASNKGRTTELSIRQNDKSLAML
jgi:hypothetical protein